MMGSERPPNRPAGSAGVRAKDWRGANCQQLTSLRSERASGVFIRSGERTGIGRKTAGALIRRRRLRHEHRRKLFFLPASLLAHRRPLGFSAPSAEP